jgi:phospholipid-binding lipoprotein MlaA
MCVRGYTVKPLTLTMVVLMLTISGCAAPEKATRSKIDPPDPNAPGSQQADEEFNMFEEELSKQTVKVSDPIEPWNRTMFNINDKFYFWVAKPVMQGYEKTVPKPARIGISNFFQNITTPIRLVNCLLQGKGKQANTELCRFGINTTAGVLGFGDPARDRCHLEPVNEDLGQTLAKYGLGNGCYIVWPILGPSTLRDSAGTAGDWFLNPVSYVTPTEASIGIKAGDYVNDGSFHIGEYEAFKQAAVDPYIAMRTAYIQYREKQIQNQPVEPNSYKPSIRPIQ